ncbi:hypothetical protein ACIGBH_36725 [Streptomyces sp. NPDC085929]
MTEPRRPQRAVPRQVVITGVTGFIGTAVLSALARIRSEEPRSAACA